MKIPRPRTTDTATALCLRYAEVRTTIIAHDAERAEKKAAIDAAADIVVAPMVEELDAITAALEPWWTKDGHNLTGGRRKSIELGGCTIGTRAGSAALSFAGDDAAALAAALASPLKRKLTVTKDPTLDKKGITALLKAGGAVAAKIVAMGFKIDPGTETFFIGPAGSAGAKVSATR